MFQDDNQFEDEVRRVGRLLWPTAQFAGAAMEDGRERDGVFETADFVHIVECTTSRREDKARDDSIKIAKLIRRFVVRYPTKFVKGWFITQDEPTAGQRAAIKEVTAKEKLQPAHIVAVSFDQFRGLLIDARSYLDHRKSFPFGSVRNPSTGDARFDPQYVPLQLLDEGGDAFDVNRICQGLLDGGSCVMVGDYGAGKSSTMREAFFDLAKRFWSNKSLIFPIHLNLRDHHGQTDPVEALERHARRVGFPDPAALVRAWRGGFAVLLLDGFDEIAAAGWAGKTKTLKELRFRSMEIVRGFLRDTPKGPGVMLSGRAHFFDSSQEMRTSLGMTHDVSVLQVSEFSEAQVGVFLSAMGWKEPIPAWLPSRPLLLGYLASQNLLATDPSLSEPDPASGWDRLLDRIANREAEIEAGIDPDTVRQLIERLAMLARSSIDALGPLTPDQIMAAFIAVCGGAPDDRGAVLLQRLPGLGAHHSEDGSRVFIDKDFAEAARGGALFRVIENPFTIPFDTDPWQSSILPLGAEVAAFRNSLAGNSTAKVVAAINHVALSHEAYTLAADLSLVLIELGGRCDSQRVYISGVIIPEMKLDDPACSLSAIEFQDSVVGTLSVASDFPADELPTFVRCHIGAVQGRTGAKDLPSAKFVDCDFDSFEEAATTTNAILNLALPLGTKVMLTILKKLYAQAGSGRRASSFYRGLDARAQSLVVEVLSLLRREDMATKSSRGSEQIWLPTRTSDSKRRALAMLAAPNGSSDPLMVSSRTVSS